MADVISIVASAYAYLSVLVLVAGSAVMVARWMFMRKGPTGTYLGYPKLVTYPGQNTRWKALKNILSRMFLFISARDDPFLRFTGLVFHWSLWLIIIVHFDLVLYPSLETAGISRGFLEASGEYVGTALGLILVGSGIVLLARRVINPYMRRISNASDYFSIALIIAIGVAGLLVRLTLPVDFAYSQAGPYVLSLVRFAPIAIPFYPIFIVHVMLAFTLFIYFPLSKLLHPFSFLTNPTVYTLARGGGAR